MEMQQQKRTFFATVISYCIMKYLLFLNTSNSDQLILYFYWLKTQNARDGKRGNTVTASDEDDQIKGH